MTVPPTSAPGRWLEADATTIDPDLVARFADAVGETDPAMLAGRRCPPTLAVMPPWSVQNEVIDEALPPAASNAGLHGEQHFHFLRPLSPGSTVRARTRLESVAPRRSGSTVTLRSEVYDDAGLLVESLFCLFVVGYELTAAGPRAPRLAGRPDVPAEPAGDVVVEQRVALDQARRYAAASGDGFEIHLDDEYARAAGLPGVILHGMCTLAFAARAVVRAACAGDPSRLSYLGARFTAPVPLGTTLRTHVRGTGPAAAGGAGSFDTELPDGTPVLGGTAFACRPGG